MTKENREMAKGRDNAQVMGRGTPGETEGGRRPAGVSPGEIGVGPLGRDNAGLRPENVRWCSASSGASPWIWFPGSWESGSTGWSNGGRAPGRAWKRPSSPETATPSGANHAANPATRNNLFDRKIIFPAIFSLPLP